MRIRDAIFAAVMTVLLLWFMLDYYCQKMEIRSLHEAVAHLQVTERPLVKVFCKYNDTVATNKEILILTDGGEKQ